MKNGKRILIPALLLAAVMASTVASGQPAHTVQAQQAEFSGQSDNYGNIVFDGSAAFNYLRNPSGGFFREKLDDQGNVATIEPLPGDPFAGEMADAPTQADAVAPLFPASGGFFLSDEWQLHLLGSGLGDSGLNIGDFEGDGTVEIVAADNQSGYFGPDNRWFVLRSNGMGDYQLVYFSETYPVTIRQVLTADADGDGISEIYVALSTNNLRVYNSLDYSLSASFTPAIVPSSLVVADADGDGVAEIILSDGTAVVAYAPDSFQLLWQVAGETGGSLAVANVDSDPGFEIISSRGYVLDGATREVEWLYPNGFGGLMAVGDVDGDGMAEIVGSGGWNRITVFDVDLQSPMWEITTSQDIGDVYIADATGDSHPEILYGDGQWGSIHAIDGLSHQELWEITNPEHGTTRIAVGDVDQDGQLEVLWGAGHTSTGADYLYVAGATSRAIEWKSTDLDGPMYAVDYGDVDDDGRIEIVAVSYTSQSGYKDGVIQIFDAETHDLEWQSADLPGIIAWSGVRSVRIGDVDQDGQTEFVIATADTYDGLIQIYNGSTHELERQSVELSGTSLTALELGDVDGDGQIEIVAGQEHETTAAAGIQLVVFDGSTAAVEWQSTTLDTGYLVIYDVLLADIDWDGQVEIAASVRGGDVFIFNGKTHVLEYQIDTQAYAIESADLDGDGMPSLLVGRDYGSVEIYNGKWHTLEATYYFSSKPIACLKMADLDQDQTPEWLVCSGDALRVYSKVGELLWQSRDLTVSSSLGGFNQIPVGQMDDDTAIEILVGSVDALYQFDQRNALWHSRMTVSRQQAPPGDVLAYTIEITNASAEEFADATASNPLPEQLRFVDGSLSASSGSASFENGEVHWAGSLGAFQTVIISYQTVVKNDFHLPATVRNEAALTAGKHLVSVSAETLILYRLHLPVCFKADPNSCADFVDDFGNPDSGWPVSEDAYAQFSYLNGEYRILAKDPQYMYLAKAPTCQRVNYSVEVDARWVTTTSYAYGLLFGLADDFSEYYMFAVNSDNQAYSLYYHGPNGNQTLIGWTYSPIIHPAAFNKLKVTRDGSTIKLEINGAWLISTTDTRIGGFTKTGLFNLPYSNLPNADARFDNFTVKLLPGTTSQPVAGMNQFATDLPWVRQVIDFEHWKDVSLPAGK